MKTLNESTTNNSSSINNNVTDFHSVMLDIKALYTHEQRALNGETSLKGFIRIFLDSGIDKAKKDIMSEVNFKVPALDKAGIQKKDKAGKDITLPAYKAGYDTYKFEKYAYSMRGKIGGFLTAGCELTLETTAKELEDKQTKEQLEEQEKVAELDRQEKKDKADKEQARVEQEEKDKVEYEASPAYELEQLNLALAIVKVSLEGANVEQYETVKTWLRENVTSMELENIVPAKELKAA